ncbi:MAG: cytochrome c peroxidase [Pseudomonadota bacterium]
MFPTRNTAKEELGKLLMFDKILSGNKNISCATCHHPLTGIGDGLSLPIGEGGQGLGIGRNTGSGTDTVVERVPRNAPHVFNLGASEFTIMFHDGRVAEDRRQVSGFQSPAAGQLPLGLESALAAQAMFPVTSATEMAGQAGENDIADATEISALGGAGGVWDILATRLKAIPEYVSLFTQTFDDISTADGITYVHAANAIAAFEASAWRCTNSPFDRFFQKNADSAKPGEQANVVTSEAISGANLFYGKAGCSTCHSGPFQTDQQFHAIAMPQIGPGKGDNQDGYSDGRDDFGRERVTGDIADRYKFRTPSLRQVVQTGPWGHDGAFNTLEAMLRHHLDAVNSLNNYDKIQAVLPSRSDLDAHDFIVQEDSARREAIANANEISPVSLTDEEVTELMGFLNALTDVSCLDLRSTAPMRVPSGLPLYD